MFPESYQKTLGAHLNESQYITLQLLLLLLQVHRQVKLSVLASVFPQPIQYGSRKRNLQRFLNLPQLHVLKNLGFRPGMSQFYQGVLCNKGDGIGLFNLAVYWRRKYRNHRAKEPWYILTNLPTLQQALAVYRCRWGIEQMFKDYKTSGYNLEDTKVNDTRFLALVLLIALAYSLATMQGQQMKKLGIDIYAGRIQSHKDHTPPQSDFSFGLYGQRWRYGMELWADWVLSLVALKPHKRLYFQRGFYALSLMQQPL
jgi:hypothetical protein